MTNWQPIVDDFFRKSDPENAFTHLVNAGASSDEIDAAEAKIGVSLPEQLRSFYLSLNGIGLGWEEEDDSPRFIRPIDELPAYMIQGREWFSKLHGNLASRFYASIDWGNGDAMGYLQQDDGTFYPFLVTFQHERYKFDAAQDVGEFMHEGPESLIEFLS